MPNMAPPILLAEANALPESKRRLRTEPLKISFSRGAGRGGCDPPRALDITRVAYTPTGPDASARWHIFGDVDALLLPIT
jgi:hypothetical protein